MSQEDAPAGDAPATPDKDEAPAAKTFSEDYVRQLRDEAARYRTRAQEAEAKVGEYEEATASETEKLTGRLKKAEERAASAESRVLRFEVAKDKEVPAEAVDFLVGSTREQLEASADKLLALVKSRTEPEPEPDFDGGARESAPDSRSPEEQHNEAILGLLGISNKT